MIRDLNDWLRSQRHLPKPLRDFHDAKALFQCLATFILKDQIEKQEQGGYPIAEIFPLPNRVAGQIYVMDYFLRFMARHGYVLRKAKRKDKQLQFLDLEETLEEFKIEQLMELEELIEESRSEEKVEDG